MWKTLQIWFLLNKSLHYHPFQYLSALKAPSRPPRRRRRNNRQIIFFGIIGVIATWLIITGQFKILFDVIGIFFLITFTGGVQIILVITATSGIFLAGKIINRISLIEKQGIYDFIVITPNGGEHVKWAMGRIIYQNTKWLKIAEWVLFIGLIVIIFLAKLIDGNNLFSSLVLYVWFIQQLVMGYLVGILCSNFKTDVANRALAGISISIGVQLGIAIIIFNFLGLQLYGVFFRLGWHTDILGWVQLFGFLILLEIIVRVLLRLIARQSQLPYAVWRAEVGI